MGKSFHAAAPRRTRDRCQQNGAKSGFRHGPRYVLFHGADSANRLVALEFTRDGANCAGLSQRVTSSSRDRDSHLPTRKRPTTFSRLTDTNNMYIHIFVKPQMAPTTLEDALPTLSCACANLRRAARAVTRLYDEELRGSGLKPTQFTLLMALDEAGETTQGKLGEILALDSTTLTRTLRPLVRRGAIRGIKGRDRRQWHFSLTAAGRRTFERARPNWQRAQRRLRESLGQSRWKQLAESLEQVTRAAL